MDVFIVGEDTACKAVIRRIIAFCANAKHTPIQILPQQFPVRGGGIKNKIKNFNKLSVHTPVILLTDLDNNICPPMFITALLDGDRKNENFVLSIAVDEVEAWLLADREGIARYFDISIERIPFPSKITMQGRVEKTEISCPCKTSLYFVLQILPYSRNKTLIKQLTPRKGAVKGPEYNIGMTPFIQNHWNIEAAMKNSDSLAGMINRIYRLIDNNG